MNPFPFYMSTYFPSSIKVYQRDCWVVGHDREAIEKAERLKDAGARVTIVSDQLAADVRKNFRKSGITVIERSFQLSDITDQFFIVLSAKNDPVLCESVYRVCREKRVLLCAIDQPRYCDVVNVSVYRKGHLAIMISTDGAAPGVSRKIRLGLEESLKDVPVDLYLAKLAALRVQLEKEEKNSMERIKKLLAAVDGFDFRAEVQIPK